MPGLLKQCVRTACRRLDSLYLSWARTPLTRESLILRLEEDLDDTYPMLRALHRISSVAIKNVFTKVDSQDEPCVTTTYAQALAMLKEALPAEKLVLYLAALLCLSSPNVDKHETCLPNNVCVLEAFDQCLKTGQKQPSVLYEMCFAALSAISVEDDEKTLGDILKVALGRSKAPASSSSRATAYLIHRMNGARDHKEGFAKKRPRGREGWVERKKMMRREPDEKKGRTLSGESRQPVARLPIPEMLEDSPWSPWCCWRTSR